MKVGYVRVSTTEQHEDRQTALLSQAGIEKIFMDKLSGKNTERPQLRAMLDFIREGDTVYVESFSRLARNTRDLLELVEQIEAKGATVVSSKENLDTSTPTGKLMLTVIAAIATFEREITLQRQREGIAIAKEKGVYKGRKAKEKPANWRELYEKYRCRELKGIELEKACGVSHSVLYKWIREERAASSEWRNKK